MNGHLLKGIFPFFPVQLVSLARCSGIILRTTRMIVSPSVAAVTHLMWFTWNKKQNMDIKCLCSYIYSAAFADIFIEVSLVHAQTCRQTRLKLHRRKLINYDSIFNVRLFMWQSIMFLPSNPAMNHVKGRNPGSPHRADYCTVSSFLRRMLPCHGIRRAGHTLRSCYWTCCRYCCSC